MLSIYIAGLLPLFTITACRIVGAAGCSQHASTMYSMRVCDWFAGAVPQSKKKKMKKKDRKIRAAFGGPVAQPAKKKRDKQKGAESGTAS